MNKIQHIYIFAIPQTTVIVAQLRKTCWGEQVHIILFPCGWFMVFDIQGSAWFPSTLQDSSCQTLSRKEFNKLILLGQKRWINSKLKIPSNIVETCDANPITDHPPDQTWECFLRKPPESRSLQVPREGDMFAIVIITQHLHLR